jgi:STE24 endopeptidase
LLSFVILSGFYFILSKFPNIWWLGVWFFFLIFGILLTKIAPIIIFPLFYKFKPVQDLELEQRLIDFANKWKFHIKGIFQFNLSKTTKKANAAFTGIGKSRRVILGDTLLEKFSIPEIETVFAHEIGHFIHKHLLKGILFNSFLSLLGLYLVFKFYAVIINDLDMLPHQLEALPYLALLFLIYSLITGPIANYLSRKFEYQADLFTVKSTNNKEIFKNSLLKLSELNLADEEPHPLVEFLLYSHPSIKKRIQKISGAQ